MNREFTIKQNELTSKIDETAASVEEMKNTPKAAVAFRATCAKNFPTTSNGYQSWYSENPGKKFFYNIFSKCSQLDKN